MGVVTIFTGMWFLGFVFTIQDWVVMWQIHVVMALFSAVWFIYAIKWKHAIRWWHVVIIGVVCFVVYFFYLVALFIHFFAMW